MRTLALVAVLVAAAVWAAVAWLPRAGPDAPAGPKRVLLITIDTMRADHVGKGRAPAIEAFLKTATRFSGARAPAPLTLPSHLTMLSGLDPVDHGVHDNAAPTIPKDRGYPLLQERFREAGYATAAFVSCAVLGELTGIGAGFETFSSPDFGERFAEDPGDLPADERVDAALAWIASQPDERPYFLWVHFFDPHAPYRAYPPHSARGDAVARLYRGEVRRADAAAGRLLAAVPEDAIVVIASDHGEGLGEHGEPTHGDLCYAATMDAFLAARGPGLEAGALDPTPRGLADIAPTLLSWCGLEDGDGPLRKAGSGVVVGESLYSWRVHGWGQVFSAWDGRYTLIETGPRQELFDRSADPGEVRPIEPWGHEAYERLDRAIEALRRRGGGGGEDLEAIPDSRSPYSAARRPFSTYLPRERNLRLTDPGARSRFLADYYRARTLLHAGLRQPTLFETAVSTLQRLGKEDATSPAPYYLLAHAERLRERHREAARAAVVAIERGYLVAPLLHLLLSASRASGDSGAMRAALDVAMKRRIAPDLAVTGALVELCRTLGDGAARAAGRAYVARARDRLTAPGDRRKLDELARALE